MKRSVSVFGSTGSVGVNTVDLLTRQGGAEAYDVVALTGATNVELLARQARQLNAKFAVTASDNHVETLRDRKFNLTLLKQYKLLYKRLIISVTRLPGIFP